MDRTYTTLLFDVVGLDFIRFHLVKETDINRLTLSIMESVAK